MENLICLTMNSIWGLCQKRRWEWRLIEGLVCDNLQGYGNQEFNLILQKYWNAIIIISKMMSSYLVRPT
jgi:hypothetical protein